MLFYKEYHPQFLSVSGVIRNWLQANRPGFIETLQICIRWTTIFSIFLLLFFAFISWVLTVRYNK